MSRQLLMVARLLMLILGCSSLVAANDAAVVPCTSKPQNGSCPARTLAGGESVTISQDDYYDVSIKSACIDEQDSWWHGKMIAFTVTLQIGDSQSVSIPVFADHVTGSGCRLPVNEHLLMSSIPAKGQHLRLAVNIQRSDSDDGLKKILSFVSGEQQKPTLSTYLASATPYVSLASSIGNDVYNTFAKHTENYINTASADLHPASIQSDSYTLQDGYLLLYHGADDVHDHDLYVNDGGDVAWINDSLLRHGATWVLFQVRKYTERTDYVTRPWYTDWMAAVREASTGQLDSAGFVTRYQKDVVLLDNDADFTDGDKTKYTVQFADVRDKINAELQKPAPNLGAIRDALNNSTEQPVVVGNSDGNRITPVNTGGKPSTFVPSQANLTFVVPAKLATALTERLGP